MQRKTQALFGWCGIVSIILMGIGTGPLAGLMPPPSANITAAEITRHFQENWYNIQIGMFLFNIGAGLSILLVAAMTEEVRRIESPYAQPLAYACLGTGTAACAFLFLPTMINSVAAFRPQRDPQTMLLLHDLATFCTYMPFSVATLNCFIFGFAILIDKAPKPVFPRWLGIYAIVYGISLVPMGLLGIDKHGALASNGTLGWWVPTMITLVWYFILSGYIIKNGGTQRDNPDTRQALQNDPISHQYQENLWKIVEP